MLIGAASDQATDEGLSITQFAADKHASMGGITSRYDLNQCQQKVCACFGASSETVIHRWSDGGDR